MLDSLGYLLPSPCRTGNLKKDKVIFFYSFLFFFFFSFQWKMGNGIWLALLPVLPFTAVHDLLSSRSWGYVELYPAYFPALCQASLAAGEDPLPHPLPSIPYPSGRQTH